ncbi:hypothetical protein GH714_021118 [Hevea brasiliensis]|uniref:Uncharacterized protein n=1 Tax=Hevea brasiliensis TaxID=3981 RepID=A0A6A6NI93_HEVBR|nr:hypothetical protein GH714_021118 [Hevea brasiliensis]
MTCLEGQFRDQAKSQAWQKTYFPITLASNADLDQSEDQGYSTMTRFSKAKVTLKSDFFSFSHKQEEKKITTEIRDANPATLCLSFCPISLEEEPGKPSGCTALSSPIDFSPKCLELPPRLLLDANVSKLLSPTTVMKGPCMGKQRFQSSSFRMIRRECYGSFRRSCSPERGQLSTMVLSKRRLKDRGLLGSWRWGRRAVTGKREVGGASYVFPSFMDREVEDSNKEDEGSNKNAKITRIRRSGSCSTRTRSRFWVSSLVFITYYITCR